MMAGTTDSRISVMALVLALAIDSKRLASTHR